MTTRCQICFNLELNTINVNNDHDVYCKTCLSTYIQSLNLSIDIQSADLDEWVLTGLEDTFDDNHTIRLRNPKTNVGFTEDELERIYQFLI